VGNKRAKNGRDSKIAECLNKIEKDTDTKNVSTKTQVDGRITAICSPSRRVLVLLECQR
jgi:hypothetical protein